MRVELGKRARKMLFSKPLRKDQTLERRSGGHAWGRGTAVAHMNHNCHDSHKHPAFSPAEDRRACRNLDLPFLRLVLCPIPSPYRRLDSLRQANGANPACSILEKLCSQTRFVSRGRQSLDAGSPRNPLRI